MNRLMTVFLTFILALCLSGVAAAQECQIVRNVVQNATTGLRHRTVPQHGWLGSYLQITEGVDAEPLAGVGQAAIYARHGGINGGWPVETTALYLEELEVIHDGAHTSVMVRAQCSGRHSARGSWYNLHGSIVYYPEVRVSSVVFPTPFVLTPRGPCHIGTELPDIGSIGLSFGLGTAKATTTIPIIGTNAGAPSCAAVAGRTGRREVVPQLETYEAASYMGIAVQVRGGSGIGQAYFGTEEHEAAFLGRIECLTHGISYQIRKRARLHRYQTPVGW